MAGKDEDADREDRGGAAPPDKGGKDKEPELVVVGDGAEGLEPQGKDRDDDDRDDRDREDTRLGGRDDDDFPTRTDPRGLSRAEKNERRNRAKDRDRTEIRFLRARNEQLERGASENAKRLDALERENEEQRLKRLRSAIRNADTTITRLTAAGEEERALEAQSLKNDLQDKLEQEQARVAAVRAKREAGERTEQPRGKDPVDDSEALPPEAQRNVVDWQRRNRWFNADDPGTDEMVVHALDAQLLREGMDPSDPEYFRELDRLVEEYLPHRAARRRDRDDRGRDRDDDDRREVRGRDRDDDRGRDRGRGRDRDDRDDRRDSRGRYRDEDRGRRPRGPTFRVGGKERELKNNEVYLDAERRRALEDMGAMDDPVLKQRYLKAYKKYDDDQAAKGDRDRR